MSPKYDLKEVARQTAARWKLRDAVDVSDDDLNVLIDDMVEMLEEVMKGK